MRELICMIGTSGSGKSTAARILEKEYGYTYITSSDYIKLIKSDITQQYGYQIDTNVLIGIISQYYNAGFNGFMRDIFKKCHSEKIVWDSCLNIHNLDLVLNCFDKVYFLCMTAPFQNRMKRIAERGSYPGASMNEVVLRTTNVDQYEKQLGLGELMLQGDWYINVYTIEDLKTKLNSFLKECVPTSVEYKKTTLLNNSTVPEIKKEDIIIYQQYMNEKGENIW